MPSELPKERTNAARKRRVFLACEHPVSRHGMAQLINSEHDLVVCGEIGSPAEAASAARAARADLVLLDLSGESGGEPELIRRLRGEQPDLIFLVISVAAESRHILEVLRAGAQGYVLKTEGLNEFLGAIRKVLGGEIYLNPVFGEQLISTLAGQREPAAGSPIDRLTEREREVLVYIGSGRSNRQIAQEMHLSPKTIETHRLHIKEKLGFKTSAELLRFAVMSVGTERDPAPPKLSAKTR
jgi:DNA-binding NarL/FixJ family response regulator